MTGSEVSPGGSVHDAEVDKLESQADEVLPLPQLQPLLAPHHRPLGRGRRLVPSQPDLRDVRSVARCESSKDRWLTDHFTRAKQRLQSRTWRDWLQTLLPCCKWLRLYNWRSSLLADVTAGLTVGVMVVPQSMSYAQIAGLPSNFGLYAAFIPVLAYALFGSSRQLAVGPVAITSLLLSNGLQDLISGSDVNVNPNDPANPAAQVAWNHAAIQVSLLVSAFYLGLAAMQAGLLTNFLSHSVISGFTSGASIIIATTQIKYFLGLSAKRSIHIDRTIRRIIEHLPEFQWKELTMGLSWLAVLLLMKHLGKTRRRLKFLRPLGPLTVTVMGIMLVWAFRLEERGVRVVGHISRGLPPVTLGWWAPIADLPSMLQVAVIITLVGLMESIAVAKALAERNGYDLDANQELAGLGMANLAGAAFCAYPTVGSFSRSAVADDTGATSGIAALIAATVVGLVLAALTPVFQLLPLNVLAAVVVSGVLGVFEWDEALFLYRVSKRDFLVWMVSFLGTLVLGVEIGLATSIGLALLIVVTETAFPSISVLGRLPDTEVYRNKRQYPEARTVDGVAILRVDVPIYFANAQSIKTRLKNFEELLQSCHRRPVARSQLLAVPIKFVVLEMSSISHIDAAAVKLLVNVLRDYKQRNVGLVLANPSEKVMSLLERTTLPDEIGITHSDAGRDAIFVGVHDAVEHAREQVQDWVSGAQDLREMSNMRRTFSVPTPHPRHLGRMDSSG